MPKRSKNRGLERFNVVLSLEDNAWIDQLAGEILANTAAKVSRSEIIRAALATLRELHRAAPACSKRFVPLSTCKSGSDLTVMGVLAVRWATGPP